jgi:hypothetical protein
MIIGHPPWSASRNSWAEAVIRPSARAASLAGLVSPAIIVSIIARPLLPTRSVMTESSLMSAIGGLSAPRKDRPRCRRRSDAIAQPSSTTES